MIELSTLIKNRDPPVDIDKSVAFAPYCCKPLDCPAGRKNQLCYRYTGTCDRKDCTIGLLIDKLNIPHDRFFIIDRDEYLVKWLKQKWDEGYRYYYPGCGCLYGYEKVKPVIDFDGVAILIQGEVCQKEEEYHDMENRDSGKQTYIPMEQVNSLRLKYR